MTVIKVLGLGSFDVYEVPVWVQSYDPDGGEGMGDIVLTRDRLLAHRYADSTEAMEAWWRVSSTHPTRKDGKPNRPLTAFTVEFEVEVEEVR